jgi:Secretion system C-terminal sorting domain
LLIFSNYRNPKSLTEINGVLYFIADDGIHGYELWKYDTNTTKIIEPEREENDILLFPNPTSTDVQIKATETWQSIAIYDVAGKKYYHNQLVIKYLRIPISHLPNGIYVAEIIFANQKRMSKKFVVQH